MKIAGWIIFFIGHLWVGALLDFNLWGIIPMSLAFLGGSLVGHADAVKDMRIRLLEILDKEVD